MQFLALLFVTQFSFDDVDLVLTFLDFCRARHASSLGLGGGRWVSFGMALSLLTVGLAVVNLCGRRWWWW
ncbi:uncharacterized protein SCHCODRAFT_02151225 [Schizophyllum commune H4-8]|uniref:uncharacterized protein n=1 Tax=Schizophyllum commune (strain H4-8 / FGSC 9210) TaxID=578458 RepID=UPI00216095AF|nr:uncharacterized protein SCHCODRAFT_02151225 [Schizophyllum commune H4-8]KAI5897870.1 hypothetical protein SCHCODRAFT_02151225 [Schizophyllum commune H4-8]